MTTHGTTKPSAHRRLAVVALMLGLLSAPALAGLSGPAETFEAQALGAFPAGWTDTASVKPTAVPQPTATVVNTTDAFGNPTQALATADVIGLSKGIIRPIAPSNFYSTNADVRIDRYSDFAANPDLAACGCPPGTEAALDWAMQVGFGRLQGFPNTDPAHAPTLALIAGARTGSWLLFAFTENVLAVIDLGVPADLGTWYRAELSLDVTNATVHTRITNIATGTVLDSRVTSLLLYDNWDPSVGFWNPAIDGVFDIEAYHAGEVTGTRAGLAVIDNIDVPEPGTMLLLASALVLAAGATARRRKWAWPISALETAHGTGAR